MTKARDAVEDFVRGLGPDKGLRRGVGDGDIAADCVLQLSRAAVDASTELLFGERREPAFHEVDPRGAGRGEVQMEARMAGQPAMDRRRLVRAGIVEDQMDDQACRHAGVDGREKLSKLPGALALVEFADDLAALRVQRGKQGRGAMARVIVRASLHAPRPQRQDRLAAIQRLNLRLLIDTQDQGFVGGCRYRPTMSRTFSINSGSFESLNVSTRWGCNANARQIRLTAVWLNPHRRAMARVLQCVAARGVLSSVSRTTCSTCSSVIFRGAPGRGSSSSPATRFATNRRRQRPTVWRVTRASTATALLSRPLTHASTMRARCARACAVVGRRAQRSSVSRSSSLSVNGAFGRPRRIGVLLVYTENASLRHLVSRSLTQDTRDGSSPRHCYFRRVLTHFAQLLRGTENA